MRQFRISFRSLCVTLFLLRCFIERRVSRSGLSFCFRFESDCNTSIIKFQKSSEGILSIRNLVSRERISVSGQLFDTHVCFLYIQLIVSCFFLSCVLFGFTQLFFSSFCENIEKTGGPTNCKDLLSSENGLVPMCPGVQECRSAGVFENSVCNTVSSLMFSWMTGCSFPA